MCRQIQMHRYRGRLPGNRFFIKFQIHPLGKTLQSNNLPHKSYQIHSYSIGKSKFCRLHKNQNRLASRRILLTTFRRISTGPKSSTISNLVGNKKTYLQNFMFFVGIRKLHFGDDSVRIICRCLSISLNFVKN